MNPTLHQSCSSSEGRFGRFGRFGRMAGSWEKRASGHRSGLRLNRLEPNRKGSTGACTDWQTNACIIRHPLVPRGDFLCMDHGSFLKLGVESGLLFFLALIATYDMERLQPWMTNSPTTPRSMITSSSLVVSYHISSPSIKILPSLFFIRRLRDHPEVSI